MTQCYVLLSEQAASLWVRFRHFGGRLEQAEVLLECLTLFMGKRQQTLKGVLLGWRPSASTGRSEWRHAGTAPTQQKNWDGM